jgi:hypothetical protein
MKAPKESQMALSSQVKESINQATSHLRDALAFAARSEHPAVIATISELLIRVESIESLEVMMKKMGSDSKSTGSIPPFMLG